MPPVGYLTQEQRRRVQALVCAVDLLPLVDGRAKVELARWIITGTAPDESTP
jgi:hypothetical protein